MKPAVFAVPSILLASLALPGAASERPDHFKGERAQTLEQAYALFSEYNDRLAAIVAKESLTPQDLAAVHELTYTLENALEKIDDELDEVMEKLEVLHKASETTDAARVRSGGREYLEGARAFPR